MGYFYVYAIVVICVTSFHLINFIATGGLFRLGKMSGISAIS